MSLDDSVLVTYGDTQKVTCGFTKEGVFGQLVVVRRFTPT